MRKYAFFATIASLALATTAPAQLFVEDFEDGNAGSRWTVVSTGDAGADPFFDYSTVGIAAAPNGSGTRGLRLTANDTDDAGTDPAEAIFARLNTLPANPLSGWRISVDMWINYSGTTATTEYAFVGMNNANGAIQRPTGGTTGTSPATAVGGISPITSGYAVALTGDGGAARDYRFYNGANEDVTDNAFVGKHQLSPWVPAQDSGNAFWQGMFTQNNGSTTFTGEAGNQWVRIQLESFNNILSWSVNGTLVYQTIDTTFGYERPILGYFDPFASVSPASAATFVVYDNFQLESVPEPMTMTVLALGALAALRRKKSK
ncbi:hypothetical protein [Aphanothece stagnina]|uniref:hypothetical protein n=1 Tax=Aphanothece stagnina TaxID=1004305 RepID=UPI00398E908A